MSIPDIRKKINMYIDSKRLFWAITLFGVIFLTIGLIVQLSHVKVTEGVEITTFEGPAFHENIEDTITVYASKSGTRYYYSDCPGLKRIKPANKVSFANATLAEKAGLIKASNCH